jgi:uncharacterized protein (TIRG00374 family)
MASRASPYRRFVVERWRTRCDSVPAAVHASVSDGRSRPFFARVAVAILGSALSAVLLIVALRSVQLRDVWAALGGARPGYVVVAVGALGLMYCLQALRWSRLLNAQGSVRWRTVLGYVVGGIACNNVVPGRPGDFARVHWAARGSSISHSSSLATVVIDRVADVTALGLGLLLSLAILGIGGWPLAVALSGLALAGLVLGAGAVARRRLRHSAPVKAGRLSTLSRAVTTAGETFTVCFRPRLAIWLASLSVLAWASWALAALAIARALDLQLSVPELVFLTAVVNLGVAIPSSPGFVGTYQWLCVAALGVAGIGSADALAYSVLLHAAWFIPTTVAGAGLLAARVSGMATRPFHAARQQGAEVAA